MNDNTSKDNQVLTRFWDSVFEKTAAESMAEDWQTLAPSPKLFQAVSSFGSCAKLLDYGCGGGWASIIAAKSGCTSVTAADPSSNALCQVQTIADFYGVKERIHAVLMDQDWLAHVPESSFDGFFCSNVLDVVPPETAAKIIRESARIVRDDAAVIISMNYYLSEETAKAKGLELVDGNRLYMDGVLRMVSRSDEEWIDIFRPYYSLLCLDHFAWPNEKQETRRLFFLKKRI